MICHHRKTLHTYWYSSHCIFHICSSFCNRKFVHLNLHLHLFSFHLLPLWKSCVFSIYNGLFDYFYFLFYNPHENETIKTLTFSVSLIITYRHTCVVTNCKISLFVAEWYSTLYVCVYTASLSIHLATARCFVMDIVNNAIFNMVHISLWISIIIFFA